MIRKIIKINEELCNGCGACASACHEGAIEMIDGVAKLTREDYCDGLGNCLPACPTGAITFEEREAPEFDEAAVEAAQRAKKTAEEKKASAHAHPVHDKLACGCPGTMSKKLERSVIKTTAPVTAYTEDAPVSELQQWPCQIKLVPANAPYFQNARLLVAADCTAFARADFHSRFLKGKICIIGCPKLDEVDYADKLAQILALNDIRSITVLRMSVPCCGGIVNAVKSAMQKSGSMIPWDVVTITPDGSIIED